MPVDGGLHEIAIPTVSRHWAAQFEWFAHHPIALKLDVPAEPLERLRRGEDPEFTEPRRQLVYRFSRRVLETGCADDDIFGKVTAEIGEESLVDLLCVLGYCTLLSCVLNVGRVPVPEPPPFDDPG